MAKEKRINSENEDRLGRSPQRSTFLTVNRRALELSEKDGSIVLSGGSMVVTAEVMAAWDKIKSST